MTSSSTNPVDTTIANNSNSLDDIFGSSPPPDSATAHHEPASTQLQQDQPSDLPSLRRQHVTAGYRDGVSASKSQHVQEGFDAGFPVGAQLGMRAGTVLGILEGLVRGYESKGSSGVVKKLPQRGIGGSSKENKEEGGQGEGGQELRREKRERILKIYRDALKELEVQGVFSGLDGDAIMGEGVTTKRKKPEDELRKMGDRVISQWEDRVKVARWELNMQALEMKEHLIQRDGDGNADADTEQRS